MKYSVRFLKGAGFRRGLAMALALCLVLSLLPGVPVARAEEKFEGLFQEIWSEFPQQMFCALY